MNHLSDERRASFLSDLSSLNFISGVLLVSHGDIYCSFFPPTGKNVPSLRIYRKYLHICTRKLRGIVFNGGSSGEGQERSSDVSFACRIGFE